MIDIMSKSFFKFCPQQEHTIIFSILSHFSDLYTTSIDARVTQGEGGADYNQSNHQ